MHETLNRLQKSQFKEIMSKYQWDKILRTIAYETITIYLRMFNDIYKDDNKYTLFEPNVYESDLPEFLFFNIYFIATVEGVGLR